MEDSTVQFINLYKGFPCLYDTTLAVYKSKELSQNAYIELGRLCNLTVAQVKSKIKSLRSCYTRHLWACKEYNEKRAAGVDSRAPSWRYFAEMDFLRPHCSMRKYPVDEACTGSQEENTPSTAVEHVTKDVNPKPDVGGTDSQSSGQNISVPQGAERPLSSGEKDVVLEFSPNVLRRWRALAKAHSLMNDTVTAQFLLEFFERERAKAESRCMRCHHPFRLYCTVCHEPAPMAIESFLPPQTQRRQSQTAQGKGKSKTTPNRTKERPQTVTSAETAAHIESKEDAKDVRREDAAAPSAEMCIVVKKEGGGSEVQLLMSVESDDHQDSSVKRILSPPMPLQTSHSLTQRGEMFGHGVTKMEKEDYVMGQSGQQTFGPADMSIVVKKEQDESQPVMVLDQPYDSDLESIEEGGDVSPSPVPERVFHSAAYGNQTAGMGDASLSVMRDDNKEAPQLQPGTSTSVSSDQTRVQANSMRRTTDVPGYRFPCAQCDAVFRHKSDLVRHKRTHGKFRCQFCDATFPYASLHKIHERTHTGEKPYSCRTCGKGFAKSTNLTDHERVHLGLKPYLCQVCGTTFARPRSLKVHMRQHTGEKPYSCDECGKAFSLSVYLKRHMRTHTGEKPYLCQKCGAAFPCIATLALHVNKHRVSARTDHKCRVCGEEFPQLAELLAHNKATHAEEKPHQCRLCGAVYAHAATLSQHRRIHTGERPYECQVCQRSYFCARNLREHMRKHTGEKPHKCPHCESSFASASGFRDHLKRHAGPRGVRPFSCELCSKSYTQRHTLMIHMMRKHPIN